MATGIHGIHSRFKAVKGFEEGEAEKEDEERRYAHDGQGLLESIVMAVKPVHDEMENTREKEGYHCSQGIVHTLVSQKGLYTIQTVMVERKAPDQSSKYGAIESKPKGQGVHIESCQHGPPVFQDIAETGYEDNDHEDKGDGSQKREDGYQGKGNGCGNEDDENPAPGIEDKEAYGTGDGCSLQFGMGDIDEYVQKCNQHEHPMGTDTGGSFQTVGLGLQEITSLGYRVLYVL